MSPNTTPSAHSARAARLVPWPGLSASGVKVRDKCDSVTSVVVGATTERSFPSQSPIRILNRPGAAVVLVIASWVPLSNPSNARNKGYSEWRPGGNPSASDPLDARMRYSAKRFPFFGLEPTGCAVSGMKMVRRTAAGCGTAAEEGDPEAGPADTVSVKPNDFLEAPWNGSRILTQSAGRLVSGEKSATAWALHTPLAIVSSTKLATSV